MIRIIVYLRKISFMRESTLTKIERQQFRDRLIVHFYWTMHKFYLQSGNDDFVELTCQSVEDVFMIKRKMLYMILKRCKKSELNADIQQWIEDIINVLHIYHENILRQNNKGK